MILIVDKSLSLSAPFISLHFTSSVHFPLGLLASAKQNLGILCLKKINHCAANNGIRKRIRYISGVVWTHHSFYQDDGTRPRNTIMDYVHEYKKWVDIIVGIDIKGNHQSLYVHIYVYGYTFIHNKNCVLELIWKKCAIIPCFRRCNQCENSDLRKMFRFEEEFLR